jgi:hypothetical protein
LGGLKKGEADKMSLSLVIFVGGFLSGVFFFGGLYTTLLYVSKGKWPAIMVIIGYRLRLAVMACCMIFVVKNYGLLSLVIFTGGLILSKYLIVKSGTTRSVKYL